MPKKTQPILSSAVARAEHARSVHVITVDVPFEDVLKPEFYTHVAPKFRVCDRIEVYTTGKTYYAELMVMAVEKMALRVEPLLHVELQKGIELARSNDHFVEHRGPIQMYCVVRSSDGEIMSEKHPTIDKANLALMAYESSVASA